MVAQAAVEVLAHRGFGSGVGRGQSDVRGEPADRAGQVVEDVGVPHEQVARIGRGRRVQVAQPQAGGLRRADRVAAHRKR